MLIGNLPAHDMLQGSFHAVEILLGNLHAHHLLIGHLHAQAMLICVLVSQFLRRLYLSRCFHLRPRLSDQGPDRSRLDRTMFLPHFIR